jgi:5-(carboxyamino)imidazole ribonucleotide synthase
MIWRSVNMLQHHLNHVADSPVPAPATIGVLGGGQLGAMLCEAGRRMGYRMIVASNSAADPAARWADEHIAADQTLPATAVTLAQRVDVLTVEAEAIPAEALAAAEEAGCRVTPGSAVQQVVRDRRREKRFFEEHRFGVGPFRIVDDAAAIAPAVVDLLQPTPGCLPRVVAKTAQGGYDGKGQRWIGEPSDATAAWEELGRVPLLLEQGVDFIAEASVIVARSADGTCVSLPLFRNTHRGGILYQTFAPSGFSAETEKAATAMAEGIAEAIGAVGLLTVEMFVLRDGRVWANELAARPHNSGHLSLRAATRSQFEMHIQAICGLPLEPVKLLAPAVMTNLLGDLWQAGEPDWTPLFADGRGTLHLYGKKTPRPGRKMGHMIHTDDTLEGAAARADRLMARWHGAATHVAAGV